MKGILGQKLGMTAIFDEDGMQVPVTAIYIGGNTVVGKRTQDRDGYTALIVGFGEQKIHRLNKPEQGFLKKQGLISLGQFAGVNIDDQGLIVLFCNSVILPIPK